MFEKLREDIIIKTDDVQWWVKEHKDTIKKVGLCVAGLAVGGSALFLVHKFRSDDSSDDLIDSDFEDSIESDNSELLSQTIENVVDEIHPVDIPDDYAENLSGKFYTAEKLGQLVGLSAKKMNALLIENGLACRIGKDVVATEIGDLFGKNLDKTTRYGHNFSNMEWDGYVFKLLFSKEFLKKNYERLINLNQISMSYGYEPNYDEETLSLFDLY